MFNTLVNAVRNQSVVSFRYNGLNRVGEPHVVGMTGNGQELLLMWQTEGSHDAGGHDWVLCNLDKIENLRLTGQKFGGPRSGYQKGDSRFININAEL